MRGLLIKLANYENGFTYAELIVSLFIFSTGMLGVVPLLVITPDGLVTGGIKLVEINELAKMKIDAIKALPPARLESLVGTSSTENLAGLTIKTSVTQSASFPELLLIVVEISWKDISGSTQVASYATYYNKREFFIF